MLAGRRFTDHTKESQLGFCLCIAAAGARVSKGAPLKVTADRAPRRCDGRMLSLLHAAVCKQGKVTKHSPGCLAQQNTGPPGSGCPWG